MERQNLTITFSNSKDAREFRNQSGKIKVWYQDAVLILSTLDILTDGHIFNEPPDVASIFNEYFSTVAPKLDFDEPVSHGKVLSCIVPPNQTNFSTFSRPVMRFQ